MDEPLSALDAKVRAHLRMEIKDLQRRLAVTTIMVTHDQEEALTMADRIVVMNHGVIEQIGTPQEIYASPASQFVADFIGTMNFLSARIASSGKCLLEAAEIAVDTSGLEAGQQVQLAVRPEDIHLEAKESASAEEQNQTPGTIESMEYLGLFVRATVKEPPKWRQGAGRFICRGYRPMGDGAASSRCGDASRGQDTTLPFGRLMAGMRHRSGTHGSPLRRKSSTDDRAMRLFILVIAIYLVIALAFPLYVMFSKSLENSRCLCRVPELPRIFQYPGSGLFDPEQPLYWSGHYHYHGYDRLYPRLCTDPQSHAGKACLQDHRDDPDPRAFTFTGHRADLSFRPSGID